jgi:hypothetical protein
MTTNKPLKFKPGVFVEVEDFNGGRKVVLTCRDQVTFVDSSSPDESTPIIYHPVMKPAELGDLVSYSTSNGIAGALSSVVEYFTRRMNTSLDKDPLLAMRVMWFLNQKAKTDPTNYLASESDIEWAIRQATEQENQALKLHRDTEKFAQLTEGAAG